jgi:hypothetical protein
MRRAAAPAFVLFCGVAAAARAQLVPLTSCHAALPCSIPYGLRPADSVANNPNANASNTAIGMHTGLENGIHPKLISRPVSEDPSDVAARVFFHRNPQLTRSTPVPAPAPTLAAMPVVCPPE